jgi:hypothetical protein
LSIGARKGYLFVDRGAMFFNSSHRRQKLSNVGRQRLRNGRGGGET